MLCYKIVIKLIQLEQTGVLRNYFEDLVMVQLGLNALDKTQYYYYGLEARSELGYAGLKNLGCICYMLAMLQQFYFQKTFRRGILLASDNLPPNMVKDKYGREFDDNVFHQFQQLFTSLELTCKSAVNPENFCLSFKDF